MYIFSPHCESPFVTFSVCEASTNQIYFLKLLILEVPTASNITLLVQDNSTCFLILFITRTSMAFLFCSASSRIVLRCSSSSSFLIASVIKLCSESVPLEFSLFKGLPSVIKRQFLLVVIKKSIALVFSVSC